ncbi:MAG: helix-turn-helix domain-containing protein [Spirochaetes bacterium]|nr:helix-turn-helix domain-containing protein [Spirochaetota bacterium]
MLKPRILFIELGIKNINDFKCKLKIKNADLIYESSFMNIVDLLYREYFQIIIICDMRGFKATKNYINLFKLKNPNFKIIIISINETINDSLKEKYLKETAEAVFSYKEIREIKNYLINMCNTIIKQKNFINKWSNCTKKAISFIKDNYHIKENFLNIMSETINFAKVTIFKSVKNDTDKTIATWLQLYRIKGGMQLLKHNELDINTISDFVGYNSVNGFIKAFRLHTGYTPKKYRSKFI